VTGAGVDVSVVGLVDTEGLKDVDGAVDGARDVVGLDTVGSLEGIKEMVGTLIVSVGALVLAT